VGEKSGQMAKGLVADMSWWPNVLMTKAEMSRYRSVAVSTSCLHFRHVGYKMISVCAWAAAVQVNDKKQSLDKNTYWARTHKSLSNSFVADESSIIVVRVTFGQCLI